MSDPTAVIAQAVPTEATTAASAASAAAPDPRVVARQRMREAVFAPFRGLEGRFGIAVKDLGSGETVLLNESIVFQAASLYKLPVMYEVFKLREDGLLSFREEMTISPEDAAMDLGSLPWPIGTRITVGTALERMVTISDNSGAFMLARKAGAGRINDDVAELGLDFTSIRGERLSTTAGDMLRLLELIARGKAVDAETSAEMVHLMARQQIRDRIPLLLPPEVTVANKTGNWEAAIHDVGIVYAPRATIAIAFLSDGVVDHEGVYNAMARAARNLYELAEDTGFDTRPEPTLPPATTGSYEAQPRLPPPTPTRVPATRPPATAIPPSAVPPTRAPVQAAPTSTPVPATPTARRAAPTATAAPAAPTAASKEPRPIQAPKPEGKPERKPEEKPTVPPLIKPSGAPDVIIPSQ